MKFGRRQPHPAALARVPRLAKFMEATVLPPPAVRADWAGPALNRAGLENILGNDELGDCVLATCGHQWDVWAANTGAGVPVTRDQVVNWYSLVTGYDPSNPATDQGTDPTAALSYWQKTGFPGAGQIAGFVSVDAKDKQMLKTAIWLFGGVCLGGALLQDWVNGMGSLRSGFVWDVGSAPDQQAGHEVFSYGYNDNGPFICTWGMFGTMTWAAVAEFAGAANGGDVLVALHKDWIKQATALSPSGFNFAQLQADLEAL